jgi:Glycosyltransferase family 9 (heptosyltransferase)
VSNQFTRRRGDRGSLIVFPGALGDFICLLPALFHLRASCRVQTTLLCKGDLVPLVRSAGLGDAEAIEGRRASWLFQREPPQEAAGFFTSFDRIDCFTGFGCPQVEANLMRWAGPSARLHPFGPPEPIHRALHFLRCLDAPLDAPEVTRDPELPRLWCTGALVDAARARFDVLPKPFLALHPGSGGSAKRWSREGFLRIAERWRERMQDVLVILGSAEAAEAGWWRRQGLSTFDDLDLVNLCVLLDESALYLGNDSGPSHLAGALGAHGVALFGPTDPALWRPLSRRISAIRLAPWNACGEPAARSIVDEVDRALAAAARSP